MWEKGKRLQEMDGEDILVCVLLDHSRQRRVREYLWEKSVLDPLTAVSYTHLDVYKRQAIN